MVSKLTSKLNTNQWQNKGYFAIGNLVRNELHAINDDRVDASEWPNVGLLEDEWGSKRMLNLINLCVLQMTQLFSTPVGVLLSELEFMYEDSSSSPEETEGGELFLN